MIFQSKGIEEIGTEKYMLSQDVNKKEKDSHCKKNKLKHLKRYLLSIVNSK